MSARSAKARAKSRSRAPRLSRGRKATKPVQTVAFCICRGKDDGRPMIECSQCDDWYHFDCVALVEDDADEISVYVCPSCQETTGLLSVRNWEGPDALEELPAVDANIEEDIKDEVPSRPPTPIEESESDGSVDEYVEGGTKKKRLQRTRQLSISSSESESSPNSKENASSRRKREASPSHSAVKRKNTGSIPNSKRKKSAEDPTPSTSKDAARKFCIGKLEELFVPIFLRYPHVAPEGDDDSQLREAETLTEDEKTAITQTARTFANDLESAMFDTYAEPDKTGKPAVGGRYKERFRMITFNLSQQDRVSIHTRIASGSLSGHELAHLDSTALANESTQAEIAALAAESLHQSILVKTTAPRAKLTHKGMVDIEIDDLPDAVHKAREEKDREEEIRREAERLARVKPARKASMSIPPESPITPTTPAGSMSWGAPPPVPAHGTRPPIYPLFAPSESDMPTPMADTDMQLGDLIHLDDDMVSFMGESGNDTSISDIPERPPMIGLPSVVFKPSNDMSLANGTPFEEAPASLLAEPANQTQDHATEMPSFDLSSFWGGPSDSVVSPPARTSSEPNVPATPTDQDDEAMEMDSDSGGGDEAFDMFLRDDEEAAPVAAGSASAPKQVTPPLPSPPQALEDKPIVWSGTLNLQLSPTSAITVPVTARQISGRPLEDPSLWSVLFPHDEQTRIDGRTPVDTAAEYLTRMRASSANELMAVVFSSRGATDQFQALSDHLTQKGRYGVVFPWGHTKDKTKPGRDMYIITLRTHDPIPDYIARLEAFDLPTPRASDYFIGVFVLNKGRLIAPPARTPASVPPALPAATSATATVSPPPPAITAPIIPNAAQLPPSVAASLQEQIKKISPEQISDMLRTLSSSTLAKNLLGPSVPLSTGPAPTPTTLPPFAQPPFPPPGLASGLNMPMHASPPPLPIPGDTSYHTSQPPLGWRGPGPAPPPPPFAPPFSPPNIPGQSPPRMQAYGSPPDQGFYPPGPPPHMPPGPPGPLYGHPLPGADSPHGHHGPPEGYRDHQRRGSYEHDRGGQGAWRGRDQPYSRNPLRGYRGRGRGGRGSYGQDDSQYGGSGDSGWGNRGRGR